MKERPHSEEHILGKLTKELKTKALQMIRSGVLEDADDKKMKACAREKRPIEQQAILIINKQTDKFLEKYSAECVALAENSVYIIPREFWDQLPEPLNQQDAYGTYIPENESIIVKEQGCALDFARAIGHEAFHLKSYQTILIKADAAQGAIDFLPLRLGVSLEIKQKQPDNSTKRAFVFSALNEAVTEELTKRFIWDLMDSPEGKTLLDFDKQSGIVGYQKGKNEDYYYTIARHDEHGKTVNFSYGGYIRERRMLWMLIDKLYKHNKDKFKDKEYIFNLFAKTALVGSGLEGLELTKLIEKTFWRGVVREFAALEGSLDEQEKFIQALP